MVKSIYGKTDMDIIKIMLDHKGEVSRAGKISP